MAQGGPSSQETMKATPAPITAQTVKNEHVTSADFVEKLPEPDVAEIALSLKGHAVELWCDHAGGRVFIVADEEDAQEAITRFSTRRGEVWTPPEIDEIELIARIEDQVIRDALAEFKRELDGVLTSEAAGEGLSPEELKAAALNRLFQEQGKTGKPGRIRPETVRHGKTRRGSE
jgi:hypothetical protein